MNTIIIACKTIKEELTSALSDLNITLPVLWIESGLHNFPKKLNKALQEAINEADQQGTERILLAMGFCGNSIAGVQSEKAEIIVPRVDDCITLLLGSFRRRMDIQHDQGTYFMTKGWIEGERNIWKEYEYTIGKYGPETGKEIFDMMFGNYTRLGILDTHCYEMEPVTKESKRICEALNLDLEIFDASNHYLKQLLTGPWPEERFITIPAGSMIKEGALTMPS